MVSSSQTIPFAPSSEILIDAFIYATNKLSDHRFVQRAEGERSINRHIHIQTCRNTLTVCQQHHKSVHLIATSRIMGAPAIQTTDLPDLLRVYLPCEQRRNPFSSFILSTAKHGWMDECTNVTLFQVDDFFDTAQPIEMKLKIFHHFNKMKH